MVLLLSGRTFGQNNVPGFAMFAIRVIYLKPNYNCCILIAENVKNNKVNSNYARKNEYNKIKKITTLEEIIYAMTDIQRHFQNSFFFV